MSSDRRAPVIALELALAALALWRIWRFFAELPIAAAYQHDYEEGNILNALLRITQGLTPYPDPHALPNILNPYGPAAYYLLAIPVKLFGVAFVYPRAMILGCTIVVAVLIGVALRRGTGSVTLGVTFALIFLIIPNVHDWMWTLRVDLCGIAFTIAGLVVVSHGLNQRPHRLPMVLAGVLFALGILVKPTFLAAPAASFFALVVRRKFASAARLTAVTAAVVGAVLGAFALLTHGAVIVDVFLSHPDPFSFRVYTQGLTEMLQMSWPLVILATIAIARDLARRRFSPAVLWLLFATLTAITAGKLGSNKNHFLEWNAALCLAAGFGFDEVTRLASRRVAIAASAIAVAAAALVIWHQPGNLTNIGPESDCPQAYEWVRTQAGPDLFAENVGALVLGGKRVWVSNPFVLAQLVENAGWSDAELVRMVRERRFDAISMHMDYPAIPSAVATGAERFSPALLRAIAASYEQHPGFNCRDMQVLYKPKPTIQSK
jgi:hypothetical protein